MRTKVATLSEAERIAHLRDLGRGRKRSERERLRDAGRPDAAAVDRAVVEAVRRFLLANPVALRPIPPAAFMSVVTALLLKRAVNAHETGAEPIVYTREGVEAALKARLLTPSRPVQAPSQAA